MDLTDLVPWIFIYTEGIQLQPITETYILDVPAGLVDDLHVGLLPGVPGANADDERQSQDQVLLQVQLLVDYDLPVSHVHGVHLLLRLLRLGPKGRKLEDGFLAVPLVPAVGELVEVDLDLVEVVLQVEVPLHHDADVPLAVGVLCVQDLALLDVSDVLEPLHFSSEWYLLHGLEGHVGDLGDVLVEGEFVGPPVDEAEIGGRVVVDSVDLVVAHLHHHHPAHAQPAQLLHLLHQVNQFGVLVYLDSVLDGGRNGVLRRALHDCDVEDGLGVVGQGQTQRVEVLEGVGLVPAVLALDSGGLLAHEQVRDRRVLGLQLLLPGLDCSSLGLGDVRVEQQRRH